MKFDAKQMDILRSSSRNIFDDEDVMLKAIRTRKKDTARKMAVCCSVGAEIPSVTRNASSEKILYKLPIRGCGCTDR